MKPIKGTLALQGGEEVRPGIGSIPDRLSFLAYIINHCEQLTDYITITSVLTMKTIISF
jgi:hypothetical protein